MNISHIIRGEDHLTNSAIHLELFKSLNSDLPSLGHNPLMLNEDGTKLSKRNLDSISINQFKKKGYTVNSILSYLYSLGLNSDYDFEGILINNFKDFKLENISKNLPKNLKDVENTNNKLFKSFLNKCISNGIYFAPSKFEAGFISTKHTKIEINNTIKTVEKILEGGI